MSDITMPYKDSLTRAREDFQRTTRMVQRLPFDMARDQYGLAVQLGVFKRSLLAWAKFERQLDFAEKALLGPWARRV
jgi:hypothetical protein